jgi:CBS domain containing-hemolysin-like protein
MSAWVWTVIAVLIVANALYVAAEFGAVGARRSRIRRMADDGSVLAKRLLPFLESPGGLDRYVGVSQIGITLASLVLGAFAQARLSAPVTALLAQSFEIAPATAESVAIAAVLGLLTAAQLILGELVPKAVALQYPTPTALATVLPMRWSLVVFRPFITLLNGSALRLLRLFGATDQAHRHLHSPEEIDLLIAESRDGGLLEPEEQERLRRALHLGRRRARDLMVALDRLTMVPIDASWDDVVRTITASPFSRLPVYRGTRDRIVGMLRVKDLVERYAAEGHVRLDELIRPVVELGEDLPADRVIAELRERRAHSAVVVNPAGSAVGLVTIQDLLSELLGPAAAGRAPDRARPS